MEPSKAPWKAQVLTWPDPGGKYADSREVQWFSADGKPIGIVMHGRVDDEQGNVDAAVITQSTALLSALGEACAILDDILNGDGGGATENNIDRVLTRCNAVIKEAHKKLI